MILSPLRRCTRTRPREPERILKKKKKHSLFSTLFACDGYTISDRRGTKNCYTTFIFVHIYIYSPSLSIFRYSVPRSSEAATATSTTDSYIRTYDGRIIISAAFIPYYIHTLQAVHKRRAFITRFPVTVYLSHTLTQKL